MQIPYISVNEKTFIVKVHRLEKNVEKEKNVSCITGVSIGDFEMEVADLTSSDIWVGKFKSLNDQLEGIAHQFASEHK